MTEEEIYIVCSDCNESVAVEKWQEHLDEHTWQWLNM